MLDDLSAEKWSYLIAGLVVAGVVYAWAADAILGRFGFGVIVTSVIAIISGYGGILAMDWAVKHHKLPYGYDTPLVFATGAVGIVTVTLIVLCILRGLFWR